MTDKQQIEELDIAIRNIVKNNFVKVPNYGKYGGYLCDTDISTSSIATALYNAGYRKVDENHIVIPLDGSKMVIPRKDQQKLLHEMYEQGKFDAIAEIAEGEKIMLSSTQVQILRHSLGMDNKPIMNNRYHAYRNYFETSFDAPNKSCDLLKHWGLMEAKPHQRGITFRVTEKGIEVLQEFLGIEIIIK